MSPPCLLPSLLLAFHPVSELAEGSAKSKLGRFTFVRRSNFQCHNSLLPCAVHDVHDSQCMDNLVWPSCFSHQALSLSAARAGPRCGPQPSHGKHSASGHIPLILFFGFLHSFLHRNKYECCACFCRDTNRCSPPGVDQHCAGAWPGPLLHSCAALQHVRPAPRRFSLCFPGAHHISLWHCCLRAEISGRAVSIESQVAVRLSLSSCLPCSAVAMNVPLLLQLLPFLLSVCC